MKRKPVKKETERPELQKDKPILLPGLSDAKKRKFANQLQRAFKKLMSDIEKNEARSKNRKTTPKEKNPDQQGDPNQLKLF